MQLILVGASIVSLAIKEWSTAIVLFVITLINAVVGLRQEGKAESAMNALKSMMEATARVRRDGAEAKIPAEAARRRRRRPDRGRRRGAGRRTDRLARARSRSTSRR